MLVAIKLALVKMSLQCIALPVLGGPPDFYRLQLRGDLFFGDVFETVG